MISVDDGMEALETAVVTEEHTKDLHIEFKVLVTRKINFTNARKTLRG